MWRIEEHRTVDKELSSGRVPVEILKRYEKWKDIAMLSGPVGLRAIKGFHDEALSGDWKGFRSSRLNQQWRVIYGIVADAFLVRVVRVTPHDYRKP
ncbi:MAG: type II toxin-antitoxin system mRNA interferase toxin, RelE/StbE family [Rudaea sp.]|uniref:type II toxin-antitoxin system mRNA interferase toxin, RelE/StbE family n=1 Tax=Rudaea sp. TaxID=2136325 RepID=UPI0039E4CB76